MFLVRSLAREQRFEFEREQAIRVIRHVIEITNGRCKCQYAMEAVTRAVVSIAEQADDVFRNLCLETLCEIGILAI